MMEAAQRNNAAPFRIDPDNIGIAARFAHGKQAGGIGAEQQFRASGGIPSPVSRRGALRPAACRATYASSQRISYLPLMKSSLCHQVPVQRDGGAHTGNDEFLQRASQPHQAFVTRGAVDDQLGDHAVVMGRHRIAGIEAGIDPDAQAAGRVIFD